MLKKFFRLFIDLGIAAGLVAAFIMGIMAITGPIDSWRQLDDAGRAVVKAAGWDAGSAYWFGVAGIIVAALSSISVAFSIVFFFRHREGWGATISSMVMMFVAIGLSAYAIHVSGQAPATLSDIIAQIV